MQADRQNICCEAHFMNPNQQYFCCGGLGVRFIYCTAPLCAGAGVFTFNIQLYWPVALICGIVGVVLQHRNLARDFAMSAVVLGVWGKVLCHSA